MCRRTSFAILLIVSFAAASGAIAAGRIDIGKYVDPRIGTSHAGQTYPAVGVPFGMTQWTPQTRDGEAKCVEPYYDNDSRLQGFRGSHSWSGACTQDYGSVTVMALTGDLKTSPATRASAFRHQTERLSPWYYQVTLDDYGVKAQMTGTTRAGFLRFSFPASANSYILIHPNSRPGEGYVKIDPKIGEVSGYNPVHRIYQGSGKPTGFSGYFVARFSKPFSAYGTWSGQTIHARTTEQSGRHGQPGAFLRFRTKAGEIVEVKIGTSFTSLAEARKNLESEIPAWDFNRVRETAKKAWLEALSQIEVKGGTEDQKTNFYTALYHAFLMPRTFSDVSGTYVGFGGENKVHVARGFTYYCDFSLWDTFRALHPLFTILMPGREKDMMQSLVAKGKEGGWLPIFPGWNSYTSAMVGDHAISVITDAYAKGIRDFDVREAYRLMRQNATATPKNYQDYVDGKGRRALGIYEKLGYIPLEEPVKEAFHKGEQVSRTLEYAYDDFALAQMARMLGKQADYRLFLKRAYNYRNVFDPSVGFVRGRHADGSWDTPFDPAGKYHYITEGLPWQYTFFVPQDVAGLIHLIGGRAAFVRKLDQLFAGNYYWHGNEPSHHIAYLYDYAGAPWKTQSRVRKIMAKEYGTGAAGLSGNDDCGQMSAWYVMSAMGLYDVCPGFPSYEIGSPLFDEVILHLAGGKKFTIQAIHNSATNMYIQSATLDGRPYNKPWIQHSDIIRGGTLVFQMGTQPNKQWGSTPEMAPPSISGKP